MISALMCIPLINHIRLFKYYNENKYMLSKQDCQHGMACSIQNCKCECHLRDNTSEIPNLEDYKSPSAREQDYSSEELEANRKRGDH
jgi:hypothetical protein